MSPARWLHSGATSDSVAGALTMDDNELREQGRIARIEAEHTWLAEPDDVVDAYAFSCLEPDPYSDDGGES